MPASSNAHIAIVVFMAFAASYSPAALAQPVGPPIETAAYETSSNSPRDTTKETWQGKGVGTAHESQPLPYRAPNASHADTSAPLGGPHAGARAGGSRVEGGFPGGGLGRTLASLAGVIGLIVVFAGLLRRFSRLRGGLAGMIGAGGKAPSGVIIVLARYPVGRGQTLILLKVERRVLLVCSSQGRGIGCGSMTTLAEFTDPEDVAGILIKTREQDGESLGARFKSMLGRFDGAHAAAESASRPVPRGVDPSAGRATPEHAGLTLLDQIGSVRRGELHAAHAWRGAGVGQASGSTTTTMHASTERVGMSTTMRGRSAPQDRAADALRARLAAVKRAA